MKKIVSLALMVVFLLSFGLSYTAAEKPENDIPLVYGDVNRDGDINDLDVIVICRYAANWKVNIVKEAADFDGDGEILDADCITLARYVANWKIETVIGTPVAAEGMTVNGCLLYTSRRHQFRQPLHAAYARAAGVRLLREGTLPERRTAGIRENPRDMRT